MKFNLLSDVPRETICDSWKPIVDEAIAADPQAPFLHFLRDESISLEKRLSGYSFQISKMDLEIGKRLTLKFAQIVEHIYNEAHPGDTRVSDCNKATERFLAGEISKEELLEFKNNAADAAVNVAYAAAAAAYNAYTAYAAANAANSNRNDQELLIKAVEEAYNSIP